MAGLRRDTWKAGLLLLLAALAGGAVGSVVTARHYGEERASLRGHRGSDWYLDLLNEELKLTPAQRDSLKVVLSRHRGQMDSLWSEVGARMDTMRTAIRADVRTLLTPEQLARYAVVTARLDAERQDTTHR